MWISRGIWRRASRWSRAGRDPPSSGLLYATPDGGTENPSPVLFTRDFYLGGIDIPVPELAEPLGVEVEEFVVDGLGEARAIGIHVCGGQPIESLDRLQGLHKRTDVVADARGIAPIGVAEMLERVLVETGIPSESVQWRQTATREIVAEQARRGENYRATYAVWNFLRLDDNGNTFVVAEGLLQPDAEHLVGDFTSKGHKQLC